MKKAAVLLTIMIFAGVSAALAAEHPGTFAEAKEKAAGLNKPVLVEFFTEW
jgi:ABC-type uncharacterized transport system substrate-binding protein